MAVVFRSFRSLKSLTSPRRSARADFALGLVLSFVAGALNAGGFLAVGRYTSHMTGMVSSTADNLVLGEVALAGAAVVSIFSFMLGSMCSSVLVNFAVRHKRRRIYSAPLLLETVLLLVFGLVGARLEDKAFLTVSLTTMLLCFIMGLQNALITRVSNAVIRTTHVTGMVTDIGIELGQLFYWNFNSTHAARILANRHHLRVLLGLVLSFFVGGLVGAMGFKYAGYVATVPLAILLVVIAIAPFAGAMPRWNRVEAP